MRSLCALLFFLAACSGAPKDLVTEGKMREYVIQELKGLRDDFDKLRTAFVESNKTFNDTRTELQNLRVELQGLLDQTRQTKKEMEDKMEELNQLSKRIDERAQLAAGNLIKALRIQEGAFQKMLDEIRETVEELEGK